jgi:hypothetical protein
MSGRLDFEYGFNTNTAQPLDEDTPIGVYSLDDFTEFFNALKNSERIRNSLIAKGLLAEGSTYTISVGAGRYTNQMSHNWPSHFPLHT